MRKGRFAGLNENPEAAARISWADLLLFDFREADDQYDEQVARQRAGTLAYSAPFLALAHLVCGAALLLGLLDAGIAPHPWLFGLPLAALLLLDLRLWLLSARRTRKERRPHLVIRLTALYTVLGGLIWIVIAGSFAEAWPRAGNAQTGAALAAGMATTVAAFMAIPGLVIIGCVAAVGAVALFTDSPALIGMAAAFSGLLASLSLFRARDALLVAHRRMAADWQADQAGRFIAEFEQSGCGWFWETNADGLLTYVSEPVAKELGRERGDLIGGRFAELMLVEDSPEPEAGRPTLGFHLSARFPFAHLMVAPKGREDVSWSLSGRPNFDEVGRFLGFRGIGVNVSAQQRADVQSNRLATYDSLTGLPNRARMRDMLDEALSNSTSRKQGCSLLLIDLDRFKQVNDTLGHPIGDLLLKEVAQRLSAVIGGEGQVGRLGGDEFEAVLPGIEEEGRLAALSEALIRQASEPYLIRGHTILIGASVGIATARPGKGVAETMIKEADLALYAAKRGGRGTFRFFEPAMDAAATERRILETDLESAIAKGQLKLVYQPVVSAATEDLVGFEALLRWHHPIRGLLEPADFLALSEASGLITGIGEWILRTACADAAKWPRHLRLAVNLSPVQLEQPALAGVIAGAAAAAELDPDRLELDLREDVLIGDSPETGERLARLKGLGVRLALDDFGAAPSSMISLRTVPLDRVKIHPSLLRAALPDGSRAQAILAALVALAHELGTAVTAEGAETHEELALIRKLGFDDIQGFLFGRPVPAEEALQLAERSRPVSARNVRARPPRHSLIRRGAMLWRGDSFPVRLRNVSADGAMIETDEPFEPDTQVELDLSGDVRLGAIVRWSQDGRVGLKFHEPFDLQRLGKAKNRPAGTGILRPDYLKSETSPDSPWAARQDRLTVKDVRRH